MPAPRPARLLARMGLLVLIVATLTGLAAPVAGATSPSPAPVADAAPRPAPDIQPQALPVVTPPVEPPTGEEELVSPSGEDPDKSSTNAVRTIRFRVTNVTGQWLSVTHTEVRGRWRAGEKPEDGSRVDSPQIADFNTESTDGNTKGVVWYSIGAGDFWVWVEATNPLIGSNSSRCVFYERSGKQTTPEKAGARCFKKDGSGNDMNAEFVIAPYDAATRTLTDLTALTRRDALDALCLPNGPSLVSCTADRVNNIEATLGPEKIVSPVLVNCGTDVATQTVGEAVTVTNTNTIGVTIEAQFKLSDALTTKVATTYQRSWSTARQTSYSEQLRVPAGRYGWIAMSAWYIDVTGDFTLTAGNQTFKVAGVTLAQPATREWLDRNRSNAKDVFVTRDFEMDTAAVCGDRPRRDFWQPAPGTVEPGATVGLAQPGANQWQIAVPGRSHDSRVALTLEHLGDAIGRNQRWTLVPVPGQAGIYQISSDNTTRLCMNIDGGNQTTIIQFECGDLARPWPNELWTLAYDPSAGGFTIANPASGKILSRASTNAIQAVTNPAAAAGRWLLMP